MNTQRATNKNVRTANFFETDFSFIIIGKTLREKERLKCPVNWHETSLINNLRILVGILFEPIAFEGLRDHIIFFTSLTAVVLGNKNLY